MSSRRFAAYFFAIAAGSTFAFASTLRGQPAEPGANPDTAVRRAAMDADLRGAGMTPTDADAGTDALSPETVRLLRQSWHRRYHRAARTARAK